VEADEAVLNKVHKIYFVSKMINFIFMEKKEHKAFQHQRLLQWKIGKKRGSFHLPNLFLKQNILPCTFISGILSYISKQVNIQTSETCTRQLNINSRRDDTTINYDFIEDFNADNEEGQDRT
jgi:hypothetical protein